MKISILLPTLYRPLFNRVHACIRRVDFQDYEIVVCSPERIIGEDIVWAKDDRCCGTNYAVRKAFEASTGDIIILLCDDVLLVPRWLDLALFEFLTSPFDLWGLGRQGYLKAFGRYYASFPMCGRFLVERHWKHFFPYTSHFGDPAFSMAVWMAGGIVREMRERVLIWSLENRLGQPESPNSRSEKILLADRKRFVEDFAEMGRGWDTSDHSKFLTCKA